MNRQARAEHGVARYARKFAPVNATVPGFQDEGCDCMNCSSDNAQERRRGLHYAWVVLALVVLAVFCALGLGRFGYAMLLPAMQESLSLTNAQTGALQSWYLAVVYLMFGFSYIIYSTFFVRHLVRDGGLTTAEAGRLWFAIGVVSIPSGFIWGALSDRFGRGRAMAAIFLVQAASFLTIGLSAAKPASWISGALFALTAWSIPAVMAALCADEFGPRLAPAAIGLVTFVFGIGQVLGPWTAGLLADRTGSFSAAFLAASAVAVVGAILAALLPRRAAGQVG